VVIEEVPAGAVDFGGRTPFRPDTPRVAAGPDRTNVAKWLAPCRMPS
jgi:hypothetical protein